MPKERYPQPNKEKAMKHFAWLGFSQGLYDIPATASHGLALAKLIPMMWSIEPEKEPQHSRRALANDQLTQSKCRLLPFIVCFPLCLLPHYFFFDVYCQFSSVQFSHSVVSDSLRPHGMELARLTCPSPTPGAYSDSRLSSRWCHPTISSSVVPFSSHLQSFPASGSFPVSQFFASGGQSIGVSASASVLPMNFQDGFPLGWTGLISLQTKGLSRVFSITTVQKHQFYSLEKI